MNKSVVILTLAISSVCLINAKSVDWLLSPQYDSMELLAEDLYKVCKNGKYGIVSTDGIIVLDAKYNYFSGLYEGIALFGEETDEGISLSGILKESGDIVFCNEKYYLSEYYPFFSEGFLPVKTQDGLYGYLNDNCKREFELIQSETRPFIEGYAAIGEGEDFHWLSTSGDEIRLDLPNGSYPYWGSNFHNGKACVVDAYGEQYYIFDSSGNFREISPRELVVDYLYRFDTGMGENVDYTKSHFVYDGYLSPSEKDGKWSFVNPQGALLSPYRYDNLNPFFNGSATACVNGKWGLVHLVEDAAVFSANIKKRSLTYDAGKSCECSFSLNIPDKWKGHNLSVSLLDPSSGDAINLLKKADSEYAFSYLPSATNGEYNKNFELYVAYDGTTLWSDDNLTFNFKKKVHNAVRPQVYVRLNNRAANGSKQCRVTATIKNPSSEPLTTTVTFTGGGNNARFNTIKKTITVPPYQTVSVPSYFIIDRVEPNGWCKVTTGNGGTAQLSKLQMIPYGN